MLKVKFYIALLLPILFWSCEHVHKSINEGNTAYFDGHFSDAIRHYDKALSLDSSSYVASFNKGNAMYKNQIGIDTLEQHWKNLIQRADSEEDIANLYHNLGNSFLANGKLKEAIKSYKSALRLKPNYEDTRYNLAYAQKLLPPEQKNKDQNKDQNKDDNQDNKDDQNSKNQDQNKNKDENKDQNKDGDQQKDQNKGEGDQEKKDQDKNKGDKGQNDQNKDGEKDQQKSKGQAQPQQGKLTKEQAKRLLDHIKRQEKGIRVKVNQGKEKNASTDNKNKNW